MEARGRESVERDARRSHKTAVVVAETAAAHRHHDDHKMRRGHHFFTDFFSFNDQMGKSNAYAGYVEAAQGVTNLVVAIPLGFVADRGSKARVVAVGGLVVPIATAATAFAVIYGAQHVQHCFIAFYLFLGAMCLWGMSR